MEGRFFEPDDKICYIFDNVNYEKLRELPKFSKRRSKNYEAELMYADMPRARKWANDFEMNIKKYDFGADQI